MSITFEYNDVLILVRKSTCTVKL